MLLTIATGALLALRRLELAAIVGIVGATIALGAAIIGPLGAPRLEVAEGAAFDWRLAGGAVLFALFAFAALWFLTGLNRAISCARRRSVRGIIALAALGVAGAIGVFAARNLAAETLWNDLIFVSGATILLVSVLFAVLNHVAGTAFLRPVMADGARYLSRDPENIAARNDIRNEGLKLLSKLHEPGAGYDRIVIVAHSLGAIVGFELLSDFWARHCTGGDCATAELKNVGAAGQVLRERLLEDETIGLAEVEDFQTLQRKYQQSICEGDEGPRWLVSDFVTVGAPLSLGDLLMAPSRAAFAQRVDELEIAACPPMFDGSVGEVRKDSLERADAADKSVRHIADAEAPHHAAMFAATRWTNLYFKTGAFIIAGDAIGGACAPLFGPGVLDVPLDRASTGRVFAHNEYWRSDLTTKQLWTHMPNHLAKLAGALDL